MRKNLKSKFREALSSVLPITVIVIVLSVPIRMSIPTLMLFLCGAVLLILGMGLFTLGAEVSMMPMGEAMGGQLTKSRSVAVMLSVAFIIGVIITSAEPDLQVLAEQISNTSSLVIILTVSLGVGIFLVIALLRMLLKIKLSYILIFFYAIVFILALFVPRDFLALAFDSGGVTTGPITVPFILALCKGISAVRDDKNSQENSFGMVALASIGPILSIMILGMIQKTSPTVPLHNSLLSIDFNNTSELFSLFGQAIPKYMFDVSLAMIPIIIFFFIFQIFFLKLPKKQLVKIGVGILYTYVGLVLFLTGVNVGFLPVGNFIGRELAAASFNWILIPIGLVIGYFIVSAEPAVHVLNNQVEDITGGAVSKRAMMISLSSGVAVSIGLSLLRALVGISLWWFIVPGYAMAIVLTFFVPPVFTAIAFDSGGVASGPMTATFLLPLAMGVCSEVGGNVLTDAFGIVSLVAMTPLIAIQLMGLRYNIKLKRASVPPVEAAAASETEEVIEL